MMGQRSYYDRAYREASRRMASGMSRAAYSEMRRDKHRRAVRYRDPDSGQFVSKYEVKRSSSGEHAGKWVRIEDNTPVKRVKVEVDMRMRRSRDKRVIPSAVILGIMFLYGSGLLGYAVAFALAVLLIVGATLVLLKLIGTRREAEEAAATARTAEEKALEDRFWADLRNAHPMHDGRCSYCYYPADTHVDAQGNPMALADFHKPWWLD